MSDYEIESKMGKTDLGPFFPSGWSQDWNFCSFDLMTRLDQVH